ncbi:hypothetical protein DBR32_01940 [Taibaiella sp. KBW10]|uniref:SdrD B-like domain-containing protein n=1 Tax=Taibaiella sp. KBW10 TaxID=2153357 RepID=UPI000F5B3D33|nr:SdrD B-like domain-containing protein [Taibaiella sp. KBW10]RQO32389.1 hypothetical protein DBR32_01940 [Taibaiella sp. KBW10]
MKRKLLLTSFFTGAVNKKFIRIMGLCLVFNFLVAHQQATAQCTSGTVYAVNGSAVAGTPAVSVQQGLFRLDPATEASTLLVTNLYGGGAAANDGQKQTSAIALDLTTNIIWFSSRGGGTPDAAPHIYSYNLTTNSYGTSVASFPGLTTAQNINKSAYNPVDGKVYFHNSSNNTLYRFDPATPTVDAVSLGNLTVTGFTGTGPFSGGDIAFDGLGNLTGAFNNANILAIFPGQYDANGNYLGLSLTGQQYAALGSSPSSVAFLTNGNYIIGSTSGSSIVNTNTGGETDLGGVNFSSSDFASCAAPSPNLVVNQTAVLNCAAHTLTYTITVANTGLFHAVNAHLMDVLPAGVSLNSITLNGTTIASTNLATTGILIKSTGATTDGQVFKGETATIVLNCTVGSNTIGSISNQAFVTYNGVESLNLPNDRIPSNDPNTLAANDATVVTGCVTIGGTIYNDANGPTGGVNGTVMSGTTVTLYAADGTTALASTTTDVNGNYSFSANLSSNYVVGVTAPSGYQYVSATDASQTDGKTSVSVGTSSVTGVNFGLNRPPTAYAQTYTVSGPPFVGVPNNLGSAPLQGSDPEDQPRGSWNSRTVTITTAPSNNFLLKYNGLAVVLGQAIPNYNPLLLTIEATTSTPARVTTTVFNYTVTDAAGAISPAAPYTVNFSLPLPITLVRFGAQAKDCSVLVQWATKDAVSFSHFELETSRDGIVFDFVTRVALNTKGEYDVLLNQVADGLHYYRLKLMDLDGQFQYSEVSKVSLACSDQNISILPTLVNDHINITGLKGDEWIRAIGVDGREIRIKALSGTQSVNTSAWVAGQYIIQVSRSGAILSTVKIIKL